MPFLVNTPSVEGPRLTVDATEVQRLLYRYYPGARRSLALVKAGGVWSLVDTPTIEEADGYDVFLQGGRDHIVDDALGLEIEAAGFGDLLTDIEFWGGGVGEYDPIAYPGDDLFPGFYPTDDPAFAYPGDDLFPGFYPAED